MPELPEVERSDTVLVLILGKTIQSVEVKYLKMIQTDGCFRQDLPGQKFWPWGRRYLLYLTDLVISHLRMEGKSISLSDRFLFISTHVFFILQMVALWSMRCLQVWDHGSLST